MENKTIGDVILSIGANKENRLINLRTVLDDLNSVGTVLSKSRILENRAEGFKSKNLFFNMLITFETNLNPFELLSWIKNLESRLGRAQNTSIEGYQDREIDVDIICFKNIKIETGYLYLPHVNNMERIFYNKLIKDLN